MSSIGPICRFRLAILQITEMITTDEFRKIQWLFSDELNSRDPTDTTVSGAFAFFQRLIDRNLINKTDVSKLIKVLDCVGCFRASQLLKDYQTEIDEQNQLSIVNEQPSSSFLPIANEPSPPSDSETDPNDPLDDIRQKFFLDSFERPTTSNLNVCEKNTWRILPKKYAIFSVFFLFCAILVGLITCLLIIVYRNTTMNSFHSSISCRPNPNERYLIKSIANEYLIGLDTLVKKHKQKTIVFNDESSPLCNQQWHFIPISNAKQEQIFRIQSAYHRNLFMISNETYLDLSQIEREQILTSNVNYQFRLSYNPDTRSCQIQSVQTEKIFDSESEQFVNRTDFNLNRSQTQWKLISFGQKLFNSFNCPSIVSLNDVSTIKFGRIHGDDDGGLLKDDSTFVPLKISSYISSIKIVTSRQLQSLQFFYSVDGDKISAGISSFTKNSINANHNSTIFNLTQLGPNERINRVHLYIRPSPTSFKIGHRICGIQFYTPNHASPLYGQKYGQLSIEEYPGFVLAYLRTGEQDPIRRIQFVWYKS